jgi:hypothetical protein
MKIMSPRAAWTTKQNPVRKKEKEKEREKS